MGPGSKRSLSEFFGNAHGLRRPRFRNYVLHWLHRCGLRRFATKTIDLGGSIRIRVRTGTHDETIVREVWREAMYPLGDIEFAPGDVVLDIGAQIGSFSLLAASHGARVLAFEPCSMNLAMLRENVALNGLESQIEVHSVAVYRPGVTSLDLHQTYTNLGGHSLIGWVGPAQRVRCLSLAEVFATHDIERCKVLKLDVEGTECAILYSAGSELLARVERIFAEIIDHPATAELREPGEPAHDHEGLMEFLNAAGFTTTYDAETWVVAGRRN